MLGLACGFDLLWLSALWRRGMASADLVWEGCQSPKSEAPFGAVYLHKVQGVWRAQCQRGSQQSSRFARWHMALAEGFGKELNLSITQNHSGGSLSETQSH